MSISFTPSFALDFVQRIACISITISSLEYLCIRHLLKNEGFASWPIGRTLALWTTSKYSNWLNLPLGYPGIVVLISMRLLAAMLLITTYKIPTALQAACCFVILVGSLALVVRSPYGHDGADQMSLVVILSLVVVHLFPNPLTESVTLWFIAGQVSLAYLTAGLSKATSPTWQHRNTLASVLATRIYGSSGFATFLAAHPISCSGITTLVILFECLFPFALLGSTHLTMVLIFGGILFHLSNAVLMRLNTFCWSFWATYPAVIYCSLSVPHLGGN